MVTPMTKTASVTTWTTCVGTLDACGICNGPGDIYECGCANIPAGDCDCGGNQLDALGVCGGSCAQDLDQDGICDDVDNVLVAIVVHAWTPDGICNGPGENGYECGCANIPAGDCDCGGNQLDALGVCGGACSLTPMATASATTWTPASVRLTPAASATVLARSTSVAVRTSPLATAIAMATSLTPSACVVALVPRTSTKTAFVTTWTSA